ncbi:MAG: ABC transporter permease [Clostridia bacterium]|nr:ABC transporter permease [Clostridia bacterium]
MKLSFRIALRFLFSSKGQTLLILLGIAIGISVQIFIGSLIQGLQSSLLDATIGSSPHITIKAVEKNEPLNHPETIINTVKKDEQLVALSSSITTGAFLRVDDRTEQILVRGFNYSDANKIYKFNDKLIEGQLPLQENDIIIGKALAESFKLKIGDEVDIQSVNGHIIKGNITGLFDLKVAAINESWVLSSIDFSRQISDYSADQISEIEMQVIEPFDADLIAIELSKLINQNEISTVDWKTENQQLLSGLNGQSTSSLMIQVFVVISVVLAIASVLAISVMQKSRQLGILKAMGINDTMASYIFLSQGFILGVIGAILGILFGLGLLYSFTTFALNPDGTPVVPILINPGFILLSGVIAMSASTLASLIPALKSKKLSPMEVIKNG